jgi:vancomycin permeability regulator SanA
MKKLILLLVIAPVFLFGQDESFNNAVNNKIYNKIVSVANSQFTIKVTKEGSSFTSYKKLENFGNNKIIEFCKLNNYNFKIINIDRQNIKLPTDAEIAGFVMVNETRPYIVKPNTDLIVLGALKNMKSRVVTINFSVTSKDGNFTMSKVQAREELIKLKELLDLGIISRNEFETSAKPLKKIVLKSGN